MNSSMPHDFSRWWDYVETKMNNITGRRSLSSCRAKRWNYVYNSTLNAILPTKGLKWGLKNTKLSILGISSFRNQELGCNIDINVHKGRVLIISSQYLKNYKWRNSVFIVSVMLCWANYLVASLSMLFSITRRWPWFSKDDLFLFSERIT